MRSKQSKPPFDRELGMVFLTTLMIIMTVSLLVLSFMNGVFLYAKVNRQRTHQMEHFYRLEEAVFRIANDFKRHNEFRCLLESTDLDKPFQLLRSQGCLFPIGKNEFYYLISDLGEYPCLLIQREREIFSSHHWLITATNDRQSFLQIRLATPAFSNTCKSNQKKLIQSGKLSWRYV